MTIRSPFMPKRGDNAILTASSSSATAAISAQEKSIRLVNSGANVVHVRIGTSVSAATATTADTPILAGSSLIMQKAEGENVLAYLSTSGTTLHVQAGEGGI